MSDEYQVDLIPAATLLDQINQLPPERKTALVQTLKEQEIESLLRSLRMENEGLRRRVEEIRSEGEARHEALVEGLRDVADAGAKRTFASDHYYTRTALGDLFAPAISAKRMTKLLRVAGIMGAHDMVLSQFVSGKEPLAKRKPWAEYPTWVFHIKKVKERIDWWLTEHDLFEDFHNTATKDDRDSLIDMLFEEYVS